MTHSSFHPWNRCTLPLSLPEKAMFGNIGRERPGCQQRCNSGRHILRSEPMRLRATHQRSTCACARLFVAARAVRGVCPAQVAKDKFKKHLEPDIYKRAEAVLEDQYEGDVGYNPGSQMIQIAGISVLDELDHFIKEQLGIKRYLRYMDDFLLMHKDLEYLEYCKDKVIEKLAEYGFEPNPKKTKVIPITEEILFLGFYYRLTETGKIIMRLNPANVKQERKKLYRLVAKAKKGELSKAKVDECFNGWKDHAAKGTSYQLLRRMEAYYKELWRNQDGISTDQNKRL